MTGCPVFLKTVFNQDSLELDCKVSYVRAIVFSSLNFEGGFVNGG